MTKLIDTHAHLQFEAFEKDREEVIKENLSELEAIMTVGASLDSSKNAVALVQRHSGLFAAVGVHPHHVDQWSRATLGELTKLLDEPKVAAVGEIGLDNYLYKGYPEPDLKAQKEIFLPQLHLAHTHQKPVLIHCRAAYTELLELLKDFPKPINGLMHCFMGDISLAKKFLDLGLYLSFSGNLTYKGNDYIREAATFAPLDRILVETDAPFLTPVPFRGTRNLPKYVRLVAETISSLKNLSLETVAQASNTNSKQLLKI